LPFWGPSVTQIFMNNGDPNQGPGDLA
jgi:hypothetical protein